MLAMVARWGTVSVATPGPPYSKILPTPPLTVRRRSISRITSLAATHGPQLAGQPDQHDLAASADRSGPPAMATATSSPPAPMASMPSPPPVGVWLSEPNSVLPGSAEALQVHLVADAVARPREVDAVVRRH